MLVDNLKHNLLSISQLCAKDFEVIFKLTSCIVTSPFDASIKFIENKHGNIYLVDLEEITMKSCQCLVVKDIKIKKISWLWHTKIINCGDRLSVHGDEITSYLLYMLIFII